MVFSVTVFEKRQKCTGDCGRDAQSSHAFPSSLGSGWVKQAIGTDGGIGKGGIKHLKGKI